MMNLPLVISIATQSGKITSEQMNMILEESRQGMIVTTFLKNHVHLF
jgi:fructoselysine and glucoselysine-specific PTS system IIA component